VSERLSTRDVYVLATLAQHSADLLSQRRLLGRLEGRALAVGKIIAKKGDSTATHSERVLARGFVAWAAKLRPARNSPSAEAGG
jgi:hypothetical protein